MTDADDTVRLTGPPEPIVTEEPVDDDQPDGETGRVAKLVIPTGEPATTGDPVRVVKLGTWVCQRCEAEQYVPPADGQLHEPHECQGCERQGPFTHAALDEYPDVAPSTLANPQWNPPSGHSSDGFAELWDDVRDWIRTNWVSHETHLYDGLTAFAISTWLRPNLNFLPQLMVMGKHETGKTQLLTTLSRVAYRARVPVSFTPAAIFRTIDKYGITVFLSEYHDLNADLRDEVNAVIKGSQKRGEDVMRVERTAGGSFEPANFDIFTHVALGTQFDPPDDIISRCIKIQTRPADREVPVWFDEDRATELRNRLLYARYRLLDSEDWHEAEQRSLEWLTARGVTGRLREKLLSLVTVADIWYARDEIEPFVEAMEDEAKAAAAESDDALVIQAILDLALEEVDAVQTLGDADPWDGLTIPVSDVKQRFNAMTGRDVGPTYIGQIRKRLGLGKVRRSDGVVIKDDDLQRKLRDLVAENNLDWERSGVHEVVRELDDGETYRHTCNECGETAKLTHRHAVEGYHMCGSCAADLQDALG